jgi:Fic family protein
MASLIAFANIDHTRESFVHPVLKAIILHFWLAYEHPFVDGNGRVARALFYWFMLKNGYWLFEFLSISQTFKDAPMAYPKAFLYSEYDDNDLTYFILYNLNSILSTLRKLESHLENRQREKKVIDQQLNKVEVNERQYGVLIQAIQDPTTMFSIKLHQRTFGVVYQTARHDLLNLAERGLLVMVKRGRKMIFHPAADLREKIEKISGN